MSNKFTWPSTLQQRERRADCGQSSHLDAIAAANYIIARAEAVQSVVPRPAEIASSLRRICYANRVQTLEDPKTSLEMADPAKEAAMKQRIIKHMNSDHQESLRLYLRHQHQLDEPTVANAKLIDINQKQVVIVASGKSYTLTLDPPMSSMKEARERMVALDADARKALGLPARPPQGPTSAARVTRYAPPAGFDCVVWFAVISTLVVFSRQQNLRPGGWAYEYLGFKSAPRFAAFCQGIQSWLFTGLVAVHGAEAALMGAVKLPKHGVPVGSLLWIQWVLSTFIDGVFGFRRLSATIKPH